MDVARFVAGLVLVATAVFPGVPLDQVDSPVGNAVVSYLVLGACVALLLGTARAASGRGLSALTVLTLVAAVGASMQWALLSMMATLRL